MKQVDPNSVLWRTRGSKWDYTFVLRPAHPQVDSWYDFHAEVFDGVNPTTVPVVTGGHFRLKNGDSLFFVASAFLDESLCDVVGRPVVHYMVWFPDTETHLLEVEIDSDWGRQVVDSFGPDWLSMFGNDTPPGDQLLMIARTHPLEVNLLGNATVKVRLDRQLVEKMGPGSPTSAGRNGSPLVMVAVAIMVTLFLLAYLLNSQQPPVEDPADGSGESREPAAR